jgi:hypothetical protein
MMSIQIEVKVTRPVMKAQNVRVDHTVARGILFPNLDNREYLLIV